jgi:hypothetical protein
MSYKFICILQFNKRNCHRRRRLYTSLSQKPSTVILKNPGRWCYSKSKIQHSPSTSHGSCSSYNHRSASVISLTYGDAGMGKKRKYIFKVQTSYLQIKARIINRDSKLTRKSQGCLSWQSAEMGCLLNWSALPTSINSTHWAPTERTRKNGEGPTLTLMDEDRSQRIEFHLNSDRTHNLDGETFNC